MRQPYFILVLAHSLHGRLRRIHIPYKLLYIVLAVLVFGSLSLSGMLFRMTLKVSAYNSLREEVDTLRARYQALQRESNQKSEQLASLQLLANEVSLAYGIKQKLEGAADIASEGRLSPTFRESLAEYDFLKSARISMPHRQFPKRWQVNVRPSLWPVSGRLLSSYGSRNDPFSGEGSGFHTGVDLSAGSGTRVLATADGVVSRAQWMSGYGRLVVVDHGNGMETYYAHLSKFTVMPGQEVRLGQQIGLSGGTGRVTGPHLHYEVRLAGTPVNPYPYLTRASVVATPRKDLPF
jgi:murein DD-endopeptidase MepM/ murein hydrolase activator NlpD